MRSVHSQHDVHAQAGFITACDCQGTMSNTVGSMQTLSSCLQRCAHPCAPSSVLHSRLKASIMEKLQIVNQHPGNLCMCERLCMSSTDIPVPQLAQLTLPFLGILNPPGQHLELPHEEVCM